MTAFRSGDSVGVASVFDGGSCDTLAIGSVRAHPHRTITKSGQSTPVFR